jgi:hypothetical protein
MSRPWSIWWDFVHGDDEITHVAIESDHPKFGGRLLEVPIEDVIDETGTIDAWDAGPLLRLADALTSGRVSLSQWVKAPTMNIEAEA